METKFQTYRAESSIFSIRHLETWKAATTIGGVCCEALDVTLDLSMQIASQAVRAKVAIATKVSVVANYSCAVDGWSLTVDLSAANTTVFGDLPVADRHFGRRPRPRRKALDTSKNLLGSETEKCVEAKPYPPFGVGCPCRA